MCKIRFDKMMRLRDCCVEGRVLGIRQVVDRPVSVEEVDFPIRG